MNKKIELIKTILEDYKIGALEIDSTEILKIIRLIESSKI